MAPHCWRESPPLGSGAASMESPLHSAMLISAPLSSGEQARVSFVPGAFEGGSVEAPALPRAWQRHTPTDPESSATVGAEQGRSTEHSAGRGTGSEGSALGKSSSPGRVRFLKLEVPREVWVNMANPVQDFQPNAFSPMPPSTPPCRQCTTAQVPLKALWAATQQWMSATCAATAATLSLNPWFWSLRLVKGALDLPARELVIPLMKEPGALGRRDPRKDLSRGRGPGAAFLGRGQQHRRGSECSGRPSRLTARRRCRNPCGRGFGTT